MADSSWSADLYLLHLVASLVAFVLVCVFLFIDAGELGATTLALGLEPNEAVASVLRKSIKAEES